MTETLRADVAIVGGGIVGASAALFLRRFGLLGRAARARPLRRARRAA